MNKAELINKIAKEADMTNAKAKLALEATISEISKALVSKNQVQLIGFGTFKTKFRKARVGRNPATGEEMNIGEKHAPVFIPGKALKDYLNP